MIEEIGQQRKSKVRAFPLFQELTARDLLQRRSTVSVSDSVGTEGDTTWSDSPLVASARFGDICVLDGIDRIDCHSLFVLRRLLQDGEIELPNGEKLTPSLFPGDQFRTAPIPSSRCTSSLYYFRLRLLIPLFACEQ